jgi:3-oxoacyl-[acyl-carrier-protein] synthase-1
MSLVPEDALDPLAPSISPAGMTSAHVRMLRLAAPALASALAAAPGARPPLLLALPEVRPGEPDAVGRAFVAQLAAQAGVELDAGASKLYRQGGAGGLVALHDALALVAGGTADVVAVGGVDTFLDLRRLAALDAEDRLLGGPVMDGFIPGEGAGFVVVAAPSVAKRLQLTPVARVLGAATGTEPGHRYSSEPYRGEGLARTFQELFAAVQVPPVRCVYAGFNGESLASKEWGVAYLRSASRFAPDHSIEHTADCLGDAGAALGPMMLGLAAIGLQRGVRGTPCLVWSTSDREARAAALLAPAA